jgi:hypothetical protein
MKNKALKLEGLTESQINAAIAVAEANGFSKHSNFNSCKPEIWGYLTANDSLILFLNNHTNSKDELTLEEWLFYGAPDWAASIRLAKNGRYAYLNNYKYQYLDESECSEFFPATVINGEVIATRQQEEWIPSVGDEAITSAGNVEILKKAYNGAFYVYACRIINGEVGHLEWFNLDQLKPIPKYTDEELLAYEVYDIICQNPMTMDEFLSANDTTKDICFNIAESGRFK